jgi:hypothetical protein
MAQVPNAAVPAQVPQHQPSTAQIGTTKIRLLRGEETDPFHKSFELAPDANDLADRNKAARALVQRAETEFNLRRFNEARLLFTQAYDTDASVLAESKGRWGYCQLNHALDELNKGADVSLDELEKEVRSAMAASSKLADNGALLLKEIGNRRQRKLTGGSEQTQAEVAVTHSTLGAWQVAETSHFRVFHQQPREVAERTARAAEQTRIAMSRKWLGNDGDSWQPKCDLFLHADAQAYNRATGVSPQSPGHSRIALDASTGRVVSRRMELRCDEAHLFDAVLPHEVTHVVLAGQFGNQHVPRWVDEGVAVLSEPAERVKQHRQNLARCVYNRDLFPCRDLMQLGDYPNGGRINTFYAQSVSLVEFLSQQKGPQVFSQFVRDGLRQGYEAALKKHYGIDSFAELDAHWNRAVTASLAASGPTLAER